MYRRQMHAFTPLRSVAFDYLGRTSHVYSRDVRLLIFQIAAVYSSYPTVAIAIVRLLKIG